MASLPEPRAVGVPTLIVQGAHYYQVFAAAFSGDGRWLLSADREGSAKVWDARTGVLLATLRGHVAPLESASIRDDGRYVVTGARDGSALLWSTATGRVHAVLGELGHGTTGHSERVTATAFAPDGARVATGGHDGMVLVWRVDDGALELQLPHGEAVHAVSFGADGSIMSRGSTALVVWTADGRRAGVASSDRGGRVLASRSTAAGHRGLTTQGEIVDPERGIVIATIAPLEADFGCYVFSASGRYLATASERGGALWDARTGRPLASLEGAEETLNSCHFDAREELLVMAGVDGAARFWSVPGGRARGRLDLDARPLLDVTFAPDGSRLAIASGSGEIGTWHWPSLEPAWRSRRAGEWVFEPAFSPDGRVLFTSSWTHEGKLWDVRTGALIAVLPGHEGMVDEGHFSADGRTLLTRSDSAIRIWRSPFDGPPIVLDAGARVSDAVLLADGRVLAGADDGIRIWSAAGEPIAHLPLRGVGRVAVTAGGERALASVEGGIELWDLERRARIVAQPLGDDVMDIAFSPDGRTAATAGRGEVLLWSGESGAFLGALPGDPGGSGSLRFGADGRLLMSAFASGRVFLWDVASGEIRHGLGRFLPLVGHRRPGAAVFDPSGRVVAAGGPEGLGRVSSLDEGELSWWPSGDGPIGAIHAHGRGFFSSAGQSGRLVHHRLASDDDPEPRGYTSDAFQIGDHWGYVASAASGAFTGTPDAFDRVWFRIGDDFDELAMVSASQLFYSFYRPSLIDDFWAGRPLALPSELEEGVGLPPEVEIEHGAPDTDGRVRVTVRARDQGGGVRDLTLLANGSSVAPSEDARRTPDGWERRYELVLPLGNNDLQGLAYSRIGRVQGRSARVGARREGEPPARRRLHVLSVAIDRYANPTYALRHRREDAARVIALLRERSAHTLATVTRLCDGARGTPEGCDGPATRESILAALAAMAERVTPEDVLVVHLTGHGVVRECPGDEEAGFRFLGAGVTRRSETSCTESVSAEEISSALQRIPARHEIVLLDACESGATQGQVAEHERAFRNLAYFVGSPLLAAAAAGTAAFELDDGSSVFTLGLLEAVEQRAALGMHDVARAFSAAVPRVAARALPGMAPQQAVVALGAEDFPLFAARP